MYRAVPKSMYQKKCIDAKGEQCQFCNTEEDIHVHHIDGDRTHNDIDNLIPVCKSCHWNIHNGNNAEWHSKLLPEGERRHVIARDMLLDAMGRHNSRGSTTSSSSSPTPSSTEESSSGCKITVDDPELVKRRTVDSSGRVYLGRDYNGQEFRVILEEIEEE